MTVNQYRQFFAEEISAVANPHTVGLVDAFATVPRENFLGPGPWQIVNTGLGCSAAVSECMYRPTPDADPRHLYHNVLIGIDPERSLNSGHPSSLASWIDALDLREGDQVLHVGCGVGYYTAIMAEVVGPNGRVIGVEIDEGLASRAKENLAYLAQAAVVQGDGGLYNPGPIDAVFVNAGATHPRPSWLDCLKPGGRLVLPLTLNAGNSPGGGGWMFNIKREESGYSAKVQSPVAIYPCIGSRDDESNQRLLDAMRRGTWGQVRSLRRESHDYSDTCWFHGADFCFSTLAVADAGEAASN
jgi:protein-L-isoaspartate(D-aspartate) O-methyltransferase